MRQNPERVAWLVLLLAFTCFCLIIVGVPLGIRWYLMNAETQHKASVESLVGTIVIEPPVGQGPTPLGKGQKMDISAGTVIRVDETSEAVVTFFDHSFMRLFGGATVRLDRSSSPRYKWGILPNTIHLSVLGGRAQIGTALSLNSALDFRVSTLQAKTILNADGSYAIETNNEMCEIIAYRGQAEVTAAGETVTVASRERTQVHLNQAPQATTGVARNLLVNGDFGARSYEGWRVFNNQGNDGGQVDGSAEIVVDEGRWANRFTRIGGHGNHCETIIEQNLDKQLPDPITSLSVRAMVKVSYQSLSGGGYLSSEYPLMIRLTYRDIYDSEAEWVQGFYYQNADGNPIMFGQQIPHDSWYLFDSGNLLESLPIRPYKLVRLRVYASGWDYESLISDINLVVE